MIWGSRVSGALRSFDPWISGWHPGSVSSGGESEHSVTGMAPGSSSPLSGDISPILYLSHGVVQNSSSLPSCIIQVCQGRQEYWVYLVIFSIIYDLDHPEKARGSAHVVRRLSVRSATRSPSTRPPRPGNYAGMCPSVHLVSTQTPLNTVQLSAQQKMGGPTLPASTGTL